MRPRVCLWLAGPTVRESVGDPKRFRDPWSWLSSRADQDCFRKPVGNAHLHLQARGVLPVPKFTIIFR